MSQTGLSSSAVVQKLVSRRLPVGAEIVAGGGVHFRVWAPLAQSLQVVFEDGVTLELTGDADGYFAGLAPQALAGALYRFQINGGGQLYPDPISRYQPNGVHGPSQVVDPSTFQWSDARWPGMTAEGQVLYEMHVGTFTPEGTWHAAAEKLAELKELGITCIEMMPVAEFIGTFGWGYDGVDMFAPTRLYGEPDDLRRFIDRAHAVGIAVILDVVYNHFGPDGNYVAAFSSGYFCQTKNDWGAALNFDGDGSAGTREYFISNARYWIEEFHFDGYRFDATQAILDQSEPHILAEISKAAREAAGSRSIYLITENEPQQTHIVRPLGAGGFGMDALWNDDFHHSAMVSLSSRNEAYFTDYIAAPQEFVSTVKYGYLFQGQFSKWQKKRRGTPALDLPPSAFVNYIQNHDQIANYGHGQRAHELASLSHLRAMTALMLLSPQTPMLFQGQEYAASNRFHYFADHNDELGPLVCAGRERELSQFPSVATVEMISCMTKPTDPSTFTKCKLDWSERDRGAHAQMYALHKDLLKLRRDDPVFSRRFKRGDIDGAVLGRDAFVLRYFGDGKQQRLVVMNFGVDLHRDIIPEPLLAAPLGMRWKSIWASEQPQYGGCGCPPLETLGEDWRLPGENWRLPGRCAVVLMPESISASAKREEQEVEAKRREERDAKLNQS